MPVAELLPFPLRFQSGERVSLLVDLSRSRIPRPLSSDDSSSLSAPLVASSVFHLRAKYLARHWWSEDEKRQGWQEGRKGRSERFPGVRTKGATLVVSEALAQKEKEGRRHGWRLEESERERKGEKEKQRGEREIDFVAARRCFLISARARG